MYEDTIEYPFGKITIKLEYDQDPTSPDEMGDCEPEFFRAERGEHLRAKMSEEFEDPTEAGNTMVSGETYNQDGDWYYGISKYEHGGIALALCGSVRAARWPDQQWDVIPLVGWIKISKKLREDWGTGFNKAMVKANAQGYLETWEHYINGEVYGYILQVLDAEENVLDEDSCWGYYGEEEAIIDAQTMAWHYARTFWQELGTTNPEESNNE